MLAWRQCHVKQAEHTKQPEQAWRCQTKQAEHMKQIEQMLDLDSAKWTCIQFTDE